MEEKTLQHGLPEAGPQNHAAPKPDQPSSPDVEEGRGAVQLPAQGMLAAQAIIDSPDNIEEQPLKDLVDKYLKIVQFTDPGFTEDAVDRDIHYAIQEGASAADRMISPIHSNISQRMKALARLRESGSSTCVAAINIGGTTTNTTLAEVTREKVTLREVETASFRKAEEAGRPIECEDHLDYWERTIPAGFIEKLKRILEEGKEGSTTRFTVEIAVPVPTKDGRIVHMADKAAFKRNPLAPVSEAEARSITDPLVYPTIASSFSEFLESKGISIDLAKISMGENDTINIILGQSEIAANLLGKTNGVGGGVDGTGFNACAFNKEGDGYNFEAGHMRLRTACKLDDAAHKEAGMVPSVEGYVSGKILGNVLKAAIRELTPTEGSSLRTFVESMDKDRATALIFGLTYGTTQEDLSRLNGKETILLREVCSRFVERAATYLAAVLEGVSRSMGGDIVFLKEGSVFDKNPEFVKRINEIARREILVGAPPVHTENQTGKELDVQSLPPSFYGAIYEAAAKAFM
jgi:hypothetical protein